MPFEGISTLYKNCKTQNLKNGIDPKSYKQDPGVCEEPEKEDNDDDRDGSLLTGGDLVEFTVSWEAPDH